MEDTPVNTPNDNLPRAAAVTKNTKGNRAELPRFKVLVHKDDNLDMEVIFHAVMELASLSEAAAAVVAMEANNEGVGLVIITHRERAELYAEQFADRGLIATLQSAD